MFAEDTIFRITLVVSFLTHGLLFLQRLPSADEEEKNRSRKIEVSYLKPKQEDAAKVITPKTGPLAKLPSNAFLKKVSPPAYEEDYSPQGDHTKLRSLARPGLPKRTEFAKPVFPKPDLSITKRKVTLSTIANSESEKINNPVYLNYYQFVRDKIRKAAYQNYTQTEEGEVYMSFSVTNDGILRGVKMIEEKSSGNEYLRDIAMVSIKDAAPFPPFPKQLDYPELTFNVIISFELE